MPTARPWRYGPAVDYQSTLVSKTLEATNCQVKPVEGVLEGITEAAETDGARVVVAATTPTSKDQVVRAARAAGYPAYTHDGMTTVAIRTGDTWRHHSVLVVPDHVGTGGLANIVAYSTIRSGTHIVTDAEAPETADATLQNTPIMTIAGTRPLAMLVHTVYAVGEAVQPEQPEPQPVAAPIAARPPEQQAVQTPESESESEPELEPEAPQNPTPKPKPKPPQNPILQPEPEPEPKPQQNKVLDDTVAKTQIEYALAFMRNYHYVKIPDGKRQNADAEKVNQYIEALPSTVTEVEKSTTSAEDFVKKLLGYSTDELKAFAQKTAKEINENPENYVDKFFAVAMRSLDDLTTVGALLTDSGLTREQLVLVYPYVAEHALSLNAQEYKLRNLQPQVGVSTHRKNKPTAQGTAWHSTFTTNTSEDERKEILSQVRNTTAYIVTTYGVERKKGAQDDSNLTLTVDMLADELKRLEDTITTSMTKEYNESGLILAFNSDSVYAITNP